MPSEFDLWLAAIKFAYSDYKESFAGYNLFVTSSSEMSDQAGVDEIDDIEEQLDVLMEQCRSCASTGKGEEESEVQVLQELRPEAAIPEDKSTQSTITKSE